MINSLSRVHTPSVLHLFYVHVYTPLLLKQHILSLPHAPTICSVYKPYRTSTSLHVYLPRMQGIPNWLKMDSDVASKFRENVFELLFYFVTWLWELTVIVGNPNNLFVDLGSHYRSEQTRFTYIMLLDAATALVYTYICTS